MIKAAFFDIDGTLLSFKTHQIPASAQQVLDSFQVDCVRDRHGPPDLPDAGLAVRLGMGCVHYAFGQLIRQYLNMNSIPLPTLLLKTVQLDFLFHQKFLAVDLHQELKLKN